MLVASRDHSHPSGAPDLSSPRHDRLAAIDRVPRTAHVMSWLQLAGSFLAIPVALGSAYSVYQVNFSPDTQCQALRSSIIAMIDKKIDAATRRMLVRRDVEAFENSCGAFDPDAKAAFGMLLQTESRVVPPRPVAQPKVDAAKAEPVKTEAVKVEAPKVEAVKTEMLKIEATKDIARKAEPRAAAPVVARHVPAEAEALDTAANDARWLEAVRGALMSHETARPAEPPVLRTSVAPSATAPVVTAPVAPALPPATPVAIPAEPRPVRSVDGGDRPVPPASIPEPPPLDIAKTANGGPTWVSKIPFVGQILDK